ncbi:hypothetical protein HRbin13_00720 [bacterium HR13]|nr:hypothetical protein HRbin13_00720 [bacterium HR13]
MLTAILVQDRLIRLNLSLLEGLLSEIKADIEESKILADACLDGKEMETYQKAMLVIEGNLLLKISEVLEHVYDLYEIFNFDITFLASVPEEIEREIERLDALNSINTKLELILSVIDELLLFEGESEKLKAILTPFRVYREVIEHSISFNKKVWDLVFQSS